MNVHRQGGFAVLLFLVGMVFFSAYLLLDHLDISAWKQKRLQHTVNTVKTARNSLLAYAVTYLDNAQHQGEVFGYLPCPDRNGDGIADLNCGKAGKTAIGLLPYRTLGLPTLFDASGYCLWYAVSGKFKNNPKTRPLNWDTRSDLEIVDASDPDDPSGGAAAVIIAPGPISKQRKLQPNFCQAKNVDIATYLESWHESSKSFTPGMLGEANNDIISWITPRDIFRGLLNRTDFSAFINLGFSLVGEAIRDKAGVFAANADYSLPANPNPVLDKYSFAHNFYANWRDQMRYLACPASSPGCYQLNGKSCNALLLFGGLPDKTTQGSWPRQISQTQSRHFFEAALPLLKGTFITSLDETYPSARYDATSWSKDVAYCLQW